jgi:hypothetical protein
MMTRTRWLAGLLLGAFFLAPAAAPAQDMNVGEPSWQFPIPTMWGQKDEGWYFAAEGLFFRLNNPIRSQVIATRGIFDVDGSIDGRGDLIDALDGTEVIQQLYSQIGQPGHFVGPKIPALSANEVGRDSFEPGWRITGGYRLRNGIVIEASFWRLAEFSNTAAAGIIPGGGVGFGGPGVGLSNAGSFLTAPFFNFTPDFAGPLRDVVSNVYPNPVINGVGVTLSPAQITEIRQLGGIAVPAFGIWNGAENMTLEFVQRAMNAEINCRMPVNQTECERTYMMAGARYMNVFERFRFRTVDLDIDSISDPLNAATYENQWTNFLYGAQIGYGYENYIGQGFSWSVEGRIGLFVDVRETAVKVERGDADGPAQYRDDTSLSPFFQAGIFAWWYPLEGVQLRCGYEFLGIFNVRRSEQPVTFDLGKLMPTYEDMFMRFDGLSGGIAFIF